MQNRAGKSLGLVLIAALVIGGICLFSVFGGVRNLLGGGNRQTGDAQGDLGRLYTAVDVDQNGCPVETTNEFYSDEIIYAGVERSSIPSGTSLFMRLYYEGQEIEDTPEIRADQDTVSCIWFEFEPTGAGFEPGRYEAELVVNGNPVDSVAFQVAGERAGGAGGALPGTGRGNAQIGAIYTTTAVDQNGCPMDDVAEFYPDEPVYVSIDESYIPQGTEIFARLIYEGQAIEDTDPIVADRDLETCVWFSFEGGNVSSGLEPGQYEAEVYVNGSLVDAIPFDVR